VSIARWYGFRGTPLRVLRRSHAYWAYCRSFLRRSRQILWMWPERDAELGENVALFVHFDRRGRLADYVVAYVRALRDNGFSVVFVPPPGQRYPDNFAVLKSICQVVVARRNVGYDFGAVREMLDLLALPRPETQRLLIANDSVYGPLIPMKEMLGRVDFNQADLWGATESWQHRYHLQSYFLLAGRRAMTSRAWYAFWQNVRMVSSKEWVVAKYEVGLTQMLLRAGLRCRAIWPYHELLERSKGISDCSDLQVSKLTPLEQMQVQADERIHRAAARLVPLNPTADLWRQLLLAGFPFIKVELLRENPTMVPDVADWRSVVADLPDADTTMIERDLQLKMRHRAP
jgi:Rhamnan synthesis protein F